ncbi:MAG: aminopeptidase P family protein [Nocardiopsaceae bacterium]|nr:aminopeptidase P family protein [Nocardiopsaceae bacterium]
MSASEFERRTGRLRACLAERELDAAVITRAPNIYYLSDFRASAIASWTARFHALIVPADGDARLLARSLESESAGRQWTRDPLLWDDHEDPYALVAGVLPQAADGGHLRLGVEKSHLSVAQLEHLSQALPGARFTDITGVTETLAAELSPAETGHMRRAAEVTAAGMRTALEGVKVGAYPYEVIGRVHEAMYGAGQSDFEKSFVAIWSGPRGGMMHDTRTTQRFRAGDIATIEIMGTDHQYLACSQTCVPLGDRPPAAVREAYDLIVKMHDAARAVVRAGVTAGQVFDAANAVYRDRFGRDYFRRVGGSAGLTLFALDLVKGNQTELPAGTPLLVQTLVTEPVLLTCATTILVTADGYDELTPRIVWEDDPR